MKSALRVLEDAFVGKKIKSFAYGEDGGRADFIGKTITKVGFGFNDSREDAGMLIYTEFSDPLFVYDMEEITFED